MRIKQGLDMHEVCGEHVVIAVGEGSMDFSKMISLNESAACLWKAVAGRDFTIDDMVAALTGEYDVDDATARRDCEEQLRQWIEEGMVAA